MDDLSWINHLHAELECKKRFLMMDGIQSLLIPVIEDHRFDNFWKQMKDYALDASIEEDAPMFLKSIENIYTDYGKLMGRLTGFVKYVQELFFGLIPSPLMNDAVGIMLKSLLLEIKKRSNEQKNTKQIIRDALSDLGVRLNEDNIGRLEKIVIRVVSVPWDPRNAAIQRDTLNILRNDMNKLVAQIDNINSHIREIIRRKTVFDYEESIPMDEPEFYHR